MSLVSYSSSEEECERPIKRRKLPPISSSILPPGPIDNPALHQGRIRSTPHVDGQFAAHVYISLRLSSQSPFYKLVEEIFVDAKKVVPTLREIWPDLKSRELHISLSRPIFLRAHQREELKRTVKNIARAQKPFVVSFATLSELINDEKTRSFLTMEVGAGHQELRSLAGALGPTLRAIRQQEYYVKPRFHASVAWALLSGPQDSLRLESPQTECSTAAGVFPPGLIRRLNEGYMRRVSAGTFDIEKVEVKIGKEISSWRLLGCQAIVRGG